MNEKVNELVNREAHPGGPGAELADFLRAHKEIAEAPVPVRTVPQRVRAKWNGFRLR